jgi:UDP-N-acetylmuramate--alanine ligase
MHIYFSGIGGTAIGPLALIAKQAGFEVSGSDKQASQYIDYLKKHGLSNIHIGQDQASIAAVHQAEPIDWFVYSSAISKENPHHPELEFARANGIRVSKRDELLNLILEKKKLQLVAIAGTHGKTTATAMVIWLFKQLKHPISYSVGAKISFGEMGQFNPVSQYFVYEADEFDRNFLAFRPFVSLITGVTWDHHEIFPERADYQQAFRDFINQSQKTFIWEEDYRYLSLQAEPRLGVLRATDPQISTITLAGHYNRLDAWLAVQAVHQITGSAVSLLVQMINQFPGTQRRMEVIAPGLYSDYAHTPEKVRGGMSVALEMAQAQGKKLIVVYEPLTNRRQHYMIDDYKDCFSGAQHVYWIPSYLAREDPKQRIIPPAEMIQHLADPSLATAMERDEALETVIRKHLAQGDMVVGMAGGGGDSLDEWLRERFSQTES